MPVDEGAALIADRVRAALESSDTDAFDELLAPDASWGPGEHPNVGCHNRNEVINWFRGGRDRGARATVTEVVPAGAHLLVGLRVTGLTPDGAVDRWQVLTVRDSRVANIRGFEDRSVAATRAGLTA